MDDEIEPDEQPRTLKGKELVGCLIWIAITVLAFTLVVLIVGGVMRSRIR